jgi:hypothetical protein
MAAKREIVGGPPVSAIVHELGQSYLPADPAQARRPQAHGALPQFPFMCPTA